jgi:hypothetical protein
MELQFSLASIQLIPEAAAAFPLSDNLQHCCGDASTVEVLRCKNRIRANEFRSPGNLQSAADDGDNEAEFERMDNAPFCKNYLLVMNASYSFRERLPPSQKIQYLKISRIVSANLNTFPQ